MARKENYDKRHDRNLAAYERQVEAIYRSALEEAAKIGVSLRDSDPSKPFTFANYPETKKRLEKLLARLRKDVELVIVDGVESEWTLSNNKNNELCNRVFGDNVGKLTDEQYRRYYSTNGEARDVFLARKENGLNLSDRVWKYTEQFREEIELGLDLGIRAGLPAAEMARELKTYLQQPDKLFRRVRDEHGQLQLSKAAKAYHPGRGVYRSSYKNARRLAATECNIAYRTADHLRWQQLDFVVGIRVVLSNNHTLNGKAFRDICDDLSAPQGSTATKGRGCYPKDFKFTGWHPLCRCHAETILKTPEELEADTQRILDGKPLDGESVNRVGDVPTEFKGWLETNENRLEYAASIPYFLKDNPKYSGIPPRFGTT